MADAALRTGRGDDALGWASVHSGWSVVQTIGLIIAGLTFVYLIVAGFVELRNRHDSQ